MTESGLKSPLSARQIKYAIKSCDVSSHLKQVQLKSQALLNWSQLECKISPTQVLSNQVSTQGLRSIETSKSTLFKYYHSRSKLSLEALSSQVKDNQSLIQVQVKTQSVVKAAQNPSQVKSADSPRAASLKVESLWMFVIHGFTFIRQQQLRRDRKVRTERERHAAKGCGLA